MLHPRAAWSILLSAIMHSMQAVDCFARLSAVVLEHFPVCRHAQLVSMQQIALPSTLTPKP